MDINHLNDQETISSLKANYDHYEKQIIKLQSKLRRVQEELNQVQQWRYEILMEGRTLGVDFTG